MALRAAHVQVCGVSTVALGMMACLSVSGLSGLSGLSTIKGSLEGCDERTADLDGQAGLPWMLRMVFLLVVSTGASQRPSRFGKTMPHAQHTPGMEGMQKPVDMDSR